jgi:glycosyltransferase involved in cell wall biosynthesis
MKILHIVPGLRPAAGGPSRAIPALCSALSKYGQQVEIYAFSQYGSRPKPFLENVVPVRYFEPLRSTSEFPTFTFYRELSRNIKRFDIVHLHGIWNPAITVATHVCRSHGKSYVLTPMGMLRKVARQRRSLKKTLYLRVFDQRTISFAKAVVTFTQLEADEAVFSGVSPHLQIIPNGIDTAAVENTKNGCFIKKFPVLSSKAIVLFLGRLHWSKNLLLQFEAMRSVLKKRPEAVWVLVGPDDGEWAKLRQVIQDHGLESRVLWTGLLNQKECFEALKDSQLSLLTSRHEGHSMAMNEALALGVPIVLTKSVGFDQVSRSGAGLVVPERAEDIANAVLRILSEPEIAKGMRAAGPALVRERYTWAAVASQHLELYQKILRADAHISKHYDWQ